MSIKKISAFIKIQIPAGSASPSPPVGPILGQKGLNIVQFCKLFNDRTSNLEKGIITTTIITVYIDRSFTFIIKTPPVSVLIKKFMSLDMGSKKPKHDIVGYISKEDLLKISKIKFIDMNSCNIDSIFKSIVGTAFSMGILIKK